MGDPRRSRLLLYVLVPYAAVMTLLALYGLLFRSGDKPDPGHPLSTIPDNFGEFDPAARKKVSQLKLDFDAPLPSDQVAGLGQTYSRSASSKSSRFPSRSARSRIIKRPRLPGNLSAERRASMRSCFECA